MHLVRTEPWATIDLNVTEGHVFVRQDWYYEWSAPEGLPAWTESEKAAFHHDLDHLIWAHWSMRATILVGRREIRDGRIASRDPLKRFSHRRLTLSFDVRKVPKRTQWLARVEKVDLKAKRAPGESLPRSHVSFVDHILDLHDIDVTQRRASRVENDPRANPRFFPAPHEFGHAIGYAQPKLEGDEYKVHKHFEDVKSIMNIGRRIRARHLYLITKTLGHMVPSCTFTASTEP